jgi:hypothetical protein
VQRSPGKRSLGDDTHVLAVVAHLPALGVIVLRTDRLAQQCAQLPPTPNQSLENGLELQGVHRDAHQYFAFLNGDGKPARPLELGSPQDVIDSDTRKRDRLLYKRGP